MRALLCVPFLLALIADVGSTLWGQPTAWWCGYYTFTNEANPVGVLILNQGPTIAIVVFSLYGLICCLPMILARPSIAVVVCIISTMGHTLGAWSWHPSILTAKVALFGGGLLAICVVEFMISESKTGELK